MFIAGDIFSTDFFPWEKTDIVKQGIWLELVNTQLSNMIMGSKIISSKLSISLFPPNPRKNTGSIKL